MCSRKTHHILNFHLCGANQLRKSILLRVENSIQNSIIVIWHEMSMKSCLGSNYRFSSLKKHFTSKCLVCTCLSHDYNWSYLEKNGLDISQMKLLLPFAQIHFLLTSESLKCGRYFCHTLYFFLYLQLYWAVSSWCNG